MSLVSSPRSKSFRLKSQSFWRLISEVTLLVEVMNFMNFDWRSFLNFGC